MVKQQSPLKSNNQAITDEIDTYLQACLSNRYFMGSVLVARADEILLSAGYGMANLEHDVPHTSQTKFRIGSITKQFTAASILQLQEQGLLQVHDAISTYLPDYPNGEHITIHHLLSHTSGIPNLNSLDGFEELARRKVSLEDLIAFFNNEPLEFTPGERYHYTNSGYIVLTKIIEVTSGYSYADYLQHRILEPLRMLDSGYARQEVVLPHHASGYVFTGETYQHADFIDMAWPSGGGGMYSTTEDLYKWERGLYTDAVLSKPSREIMFSPKVTVLETKDGKGYYHSYGGITCTHYDRKLLYHGGGIDGFSTRIARYPDEQVSIIVLTNLDPEIATPVVAIANDVAAILFSQPYRLPKQRQAIDIDPAIYNTYVGQYELELGWVMNVTTEANRIFTQWIGQSRIELFPESATKFFTKLIDSQRTFVVDQTGKAIQVVVHQGGQDRVAKRVD